MHINIKKWQFWAITLTIINVLLSSWWLLNGDIHYDIDISRDFLVISEILDSGHFTLIGPRSGMIGGVFHGPLWYYINLPAFFATSGNPILMGWFWWGLSILALVVFWWVAKELLNKDVALLSVLLYSANSIINPSVGLKQFFNPYGAVILSPLFFYLLVRYTQNKKPLNLALTLFCLGLIIQFQMAFGIPIFMLCTIFLLYFLYTQKLLKHLFIFPIIAIPLSTFIIFDLKHDFLQTRAFLEFIFNNHTLANAISSIPLVQKIGTIFTDPFSLLVQDNIILGWIYALLFIFLFFKLKLFRKKIPYLLFFYFYAGFLILYFFFRNSVNTYHWPFLPLIIMIFVSLYNLLPKKFFMAIYLPLLIWNFYIGAVYIKDFNPNITSRGVNSWAYNRLLAENVYKDADGSFGYYIFTPDRWVYNQWYALKYLQREYPNKTSYPFVKKSLTYLIIMDSPKDRPDIDSTGWRISDIKIDKNFENMWRLDVAQIQKYLLTDQEIKLPSNPYLINSTFFR